MCRARYTVSSRDWVVKNNFIYDIYGDSERSRGGSGIQSYGTINAQIQQNTIEDVAFGVRWSEHFIPSTVGAEPLFESDISYNKISASTYGVDISGRQHNEAGRNAIHHNIVQTSHVESNAIRYVMSTVDRATTAEQAIQHNVLFGQAQNQTDGVLLSGVTNVNFEGNIILGYSRAFTSAYVSSLPVGIQYSDYNIFDGTLGSIALLDRYSSSSTLYSSLSSWQSALANDTISLGVDDPDGHSITASTAELFSDVVNFTYSFDSPAVGFMEDGTNAGVYQFGNEVIGKTF